VPVNRKNKGEVHIRLPVRFVVACNELPGFLDPSGALAARLVIFTLWNSFLGREDFDLGRTLEAELPGIAQFALEGLRMLLVEDGRFIEPDSAKQVAAEFRATQAPTLAFLDECVEEGSAKDWMSNNDLYAVYIAWAKERGHKVSSEAKLYSKLRQKWPARAEASKERRAGVNGERYRQRSHFKLSAEGLEYLKASGVFPT